MKNFSNPTKPINLQSNAINLNDKPTMFNSLSPSSLHSLDGLIVLDVLLVYSELPIDMEFHYYTTSPNSNEFNLGTLNR